MTFWDFVDANVEAVSGVVVSGMVFLAVIYLIRLVVPPEDQ